MRPLIETRLRYYGLLDCVELLGHVDDVPGVLARAAVACDLRHDGLPSRALAEAMMAALPAVTTCLELGDPRLVVPPRAPEVLAERLLGLLRDPARARMLGDAARRLAERDLSLEAARRQLGTVYAAALTVPGDRATPPRALLHPDPAARGVPGH
jgi:glycosyltransferase involved in cell wall biosynthesis